MNLRELRIKRGLTLTEVAAKVQTDPGNLSRIERGIQPPSAELALRIWRFYGRRISLEKILSAEIAA